MQRIGLIASGSYAPARVLDNTEIATLVETTDEWIVAHTGIRERRVAAADEYPSDLAVKAAAACLVKSTVRPQLLVSSTGSTERSFPYQASTVAGRLGLTDLAAFDLNAACSGFVYGLAVAAALLRDGAGETALVTAAEKMTAYTDYTDRASCILYGDGAGAVLLGTAGWEHELLCTELALDGGGHEWITMGHRWGEHAIRQQGAKVFKFMVPKLAALLASLFAKTSLAPGQPFHVIPHQSGIRTIEALSERTGVPMERFVLNLERYGNTSSASIPIALDEAWTAGRFNKGDLVYLLGFGGGISWAGAAIRW